MICLLVKKMVRVYPTAEDIDELSLATASRDSNDVSSIYHYN